jgi:hypothetical protein
MFLEIVKDIRNGRMRSHSIVSKKDMIVKHPYCMDLRSWADVGRINSRFGLSNKEASFLYVKTDKTDTKELDQLARSL